MQEAPSSRESAEQLPWKHFFQGELRTLERDGKTVVSMRVDGQERAFEFPKGTDVLGSALPLVLSTHAITYVPDLGMFHSTKEPLGQQARRFAAMTYEQMLSAIPRASVPSFDRETYEAVKSFAGNIALRGAKILGGSLKYGMYSLFLANVRNANYDLKSYVKDLSIFAGFQAGTASPRIAAALARETAHLTGGRVGAGAAAALERLAVGAPPWVRMLLATLLGIGGAVGADKLLSAAKMNKGAWLLHPDQFSGRLGEGANSIL